MSAVLVGILVLGMVVGAVLAGGARLAVRQLDPEQRALYLARQEALFPWKVLAGQVSRGAGVLLVVAATMGVLRAAWIGLGWLERKSRVVYARDGLFALIEVARGVFYDPNRDNPGAHPLITVKALDVQRAQALAREGSRLSVKVAGSPADSLSEPAALPSPYEMELPTRVPLRGLLDGPPSLHNLVLGVAINARGEQEVITGDLAQMVHSAVGGTSGWGKSVFLRGVAWQCVNALERPDMALIDLEGVTLSPFAQSERLRFPLADSVETALDVLRGAEGEIERRKGLFSRYPGVDSLSKYNALAAEILAPFVIMIDEATALLANRSVEGLLRDVVLRARKYGVWLILAGQDWKASSLDTAIRNQLGARFQFKTMSASQARVLMENGDAAGFDVRGRMQAWIPGRPLVEAQAPYIGSEMLQLRDEGSQAAAMVDDEGLPDDERVRLLYKQGASKRQIEMRVRGYTGGAATAFVDAVLGGV
jgi:hypothetical protein